MMASASRGTDLTISVIDSHTGGEPTRVITGGFPELAGASLAERREDLVANHLHIAHLIVAEPRGNEAMVGALLVEPEEPGSAAGVIFFDGEAALGMCGHGTIGLVETLKWLGAVEGSVVHVETPVGVIAANLNADQTISIGNVPSRRVAKAVELDVPGIGAVTGDVAYGGNTFFLVTAPAMDLDRPIRALLADAEAIKAVVHKTGFTDVDHIELFGPPNHPDANSRSFVLCPSGTYDRSPCGTGTSAKVACLAADGLLEEGDVWIQESVTGSLFEAEFQWADRSRLEVVPRITGSASVIARGELFITVDEIRSAAQVPGSRRR